MLFQLDSLNMATVLVVDDTPDNLLLMNSLLKDEYLVKVASNGERALKIAFSEAVVDLILLDIMMTGIDGYEVCRQLKANPRTQDIPIIFLTAMSAVDDEKRGLEIGGADFITKPVNPPIVLARVRTQLENKRARDLLKKQNEYLDEEVKRRTQDLLAAQGKLEHLIQTGLDLEREQDRLALLQKILSSGQSLLHCDAGFLYLVSANKSLHCAMMTLQDGERLLPDIPLYDSHGIPMEREVCAYCALHNKLVIIDDIDSESRFDLSQTRLRDMASGYRTLSLLTVPLVARAGEVIGVVQFINALDPVTSIRTAFNPELIRFVTAMAAQAAVVLDNHQLIAAQKELMDSLIQLIASAIDAKSPYTRGHCERVPELAIMLAEEAGRVDEGELADFSFKSDAEWREFRIGAWLHDCGKVTTPEYVVDKATKLETIYNRIHEVRMRFEVLLRDAMLERLEAMAAGDLPQTVEQRFAQRSVQLHEDFAFLAECNLGGEFMAPEKIERIKRIAEESWLRHFDDRLGLAHDELKRYTGEQEILPILEPLLADKHHHIIPRTDTRVPDQTNNFNIAVPEFLYNHGEIHNLCIMRGTLTEEERFKINEHIIQTIIMLEQLPLLKNMRRVPEYAGTHHETLTGSGYPRKLNKGQLSIPSRIMAIADIFEALTASDRPYKKFKTLSEAIKILYYFKRDNHIDPVLFDLFLTSRIYQRYADKYLLPEQIDTVQIEQFIH